MKFTEISGKDSRGLQNQNPCRTIFRTDHSQSMSHLRILLEHQISGHDILRYMRGGKHVPAFPYFFFIIESYYFPSDAV